MSKSRDVSKLFSLFGEKKVEQYQEIYETEQNQEARLRWPIFQSIPLNSTDIPAHKEPIMGSAAPDHDQINTDEKSVTDVDVTVIIDEAPTESVANRQVHSGSLQSLFNRLQGIDEIAAEPETLPAEPSEPTAGSIRSLFNRLSH